MVHRVALVGGMEPLGVGPSERKLGHWGMTLRRLLEPSPFPFLSYFLATR